MGLDRRNWRKPYTEDELKSMLAAGEMLQLRQRVVELETQLAKNNPLLDEAADAIDALNQQRADLLAALEFVADAYEGSPRDERTMGFYEARNRARAAIASVKEKQNEN